MATDYEEKIIKRGDLAEIKAYETAGRMTLDNLGEDEMVPTQAKRSLITTVEILQYLLKLIDPEIEITSLEELKNQDHEGWSSQSITIPTEKLEALDRDYFESLVNSVMRLINDKRATEDSKVGSKIEARMKSMQEQLKLIK